MGTHTQSHSPSSLRNIAVIAHGGAGKTTLIESLLFLTGAIKAKGQIERGKATMITEPEESSHHMAITNHIGHVHWKGHAIYFVDSPGYFNFLENARGALPAVDGVVFLFTGTEGVKPETERLWGMVREAGIPTIGFVNQMDHEGADLARAVTLIEKALQQPVEPLSYPLRKGDALVGVVDLLTQKVSSFTQGKASESVASDEMKGDLLRARTHLIERIAEQNDTLLEKYLGGEALSEGELITGLKRSTQERSLVPLLCGSGASDIGITLLLEYITSLLPSPIERDTLRPVVGHPPGKEDISLQRHCRTEDPFSARVIKTTIDPFFGKLSIIRMFSGQVKGNDQIINSSRNAKQKVGHLYLMQGKELAQIDVLSAGEIGAIAKLEDTHTGDTICASESPILYPGVHFGEPPVAYAIVSEGKNDEKVSLGLQKLVDEDPSLHFYRDEQTHQMILAGMGQTHIEVTLERLERKFGAHATLTTRKVPYRETIKKSVKAQGKLKKQSGGHGQFANTWIEVSPLERNTGFVFEDQIVGGIIPKQYIPSVKKGVQEAMSKGPLGGYPLVDIKVALYDGSFHDVDSSDYAFQVAGSLGFKAAVEEASPVLLEPIMSMRILVPEECAGAIIKDVSGRRGKVLGFDADGEWREVHAEIPMAEVLEYGHQLGAMTSGRGTYTMHVHLYQEVPAHLVTKVLEEKKQAVG